jgi:hypothetical protein
MVAMMLLFITAGTITKLFALGEGESGGHVLCDTTSRGWCGRGWPSRTSGTATPSALATKPNAKLEKIKKIGKLALAHSITRKKQAKAFKTAVKVDDAQAMLTSCTVQRFAGYAAPSLFTN